MYATLFRGTDRLYRTTQRQFNVVECAACGMIRLHPMPGADELKDFYPETYWWQAEQSAAGRLSELYRRTVLSDHVRFCSRSIDSDGPVLDIGCGGGLFLDALARRGARVVGMDISPQAASVAWSRYGAPAACGVVPHPPFRPRSFAAVTMFHVLEHVPDPMECVLSIWDLLAPGGKLIIQVPNAACWQFLLLGERWSGLDIPRHLIDFRAADLEHLLQAAGFEVRRRKFFSLRDNPAGLATSLLPRLDPVSRRVRKVKESAAGSLLKDCLYLALVAAAVPFTLLEAAAGAGSTVMIEAVRKGEG